MIAAPKGSTRHTGRLLTALAAVFALVVGVGVFTSIPASAAGPIDAQGVVLAPSASCAYGDVDITYAAASVSDASVAFTSEDGAVLDAYAGAAYQSDYVGTEHVITEADDPVAPGTVVAVYVWVGAAPPSAATTAEFFVLYRCDAQGNADGGQNQVLDTCFGDYGSCPQTAQEALTPETTTTSTRSPAVPDPTLDEGPTSPIPSGLAIPRFTG
jgi:hypothetical protein